MYNLTGSYLVPLPCEVIAVMQVEWPAIDSDECTKPEVTRAIADGAIDFGGWPGVFGILHNKATLGKCTRHEPKTLKMGFIV